MARKAAKIDSNQPEIVEALRAMGCTVQSTASIGDGFPDLIVAIEGECFVLEVKVPGEQLNPRQRRWHNEWVGRAYVVWTIDQALAIAKKYLTRGIAFPI
jgi:hypothetical protein